MSTALFDTVIIGTAIGKTAGDCPPSAGRKVAVIEREHVGGTCIT